MEQKYRDILYKNYDVMLTKGEALEDSEAEKQTIAKYFERNYLPYFPSNKECMIADIGCGKGNFLYACQKQGYKNIIGIDLSEQNINYCKKQDYPCIQSEGLEYLKSNKNTLDVIIFNDVIEHLTKDEVLEMILAMKDALRENGKVFVKTLNMANPYTGPACLYIDFTHETGYTEMNLVQIFENLGFADVMVFGADIYVFKGFVNFAAKIMSKMICRSLRFKSHLFGRKSIKIFEKSLICVAQKGV